MDSFVLLQDKIHFNMIISKTFFPKKEESEILDGKE
jgi:hypothetical protein